MYGVSTPLPEGKAEGNSAETPLPEGKGTIGIDRLQGDQTLG
jgi:hypothetical protein